MAERICELGTCEEYQYVVVYSIENGKILLSRHKNRSTWELQGGHIEVGEEPIDAARRELYEESGAVKYDIQPVCDIENVVEGESHFGRLYFAVIHKRNALPESEIAEVGLFDTMPSDLTYLGITRRIVDFMERKEIV